MLARALEVFGHRECYVFDPYRLIRERYGRYRVREQRVVSAGAFQKIAWRRVEEPEPFVQRWPGRVVATVAQPTVGLADFRFADSDLLAFGSESQGLPGALVSQCAASITIPSHGQTQSLNLAVALGIALFECSRQLSAAVAAGS